MCVLLCCGRLRGCYLLWGTRGGLKLVSKYFSAVASPLYHFETGSLTEPEDPCFA